MAAAVDTEKVTDTFDVGAGTAQVNHDLDCGLLAEAKDATDQEHQMSIIQAIKLYPKAVGWSLVLSLAIIMEGYDLILLGSFYAFPTFVQKYGELRPDGSYQISAAWQAGLGNGARAGEILGLFATGIISERFGYRKTMLGALFALTGFVFILFFAKDVVMLQVGEVLCGIPWGVFQTLTTTYAAEVCPVALRAYLTTYVNLCWVIGQFIASGILRGMLSRSDEWSYRIPFALQWIWPVPIAVGVFLAPESPWWLVRKGRNEEAGKSLRRLTRKNDPNFNVERTVAMMIHTNEIEKNVSQGTSYLDCFRGTNLRRTEISCLVWGIQVLCGTGLMTYSTYFYKQAGLPTTQSFNMTLAQYGLGIIGTLGSWFLLTRFGRRTMYLGGLVILDILLLAIGFISIAPASNPRASWAIGSLLLVFIFVYDTTIGPVTYSLVSEIPSTRLRSKAIVCARNLYIFCSIINGVITPYMLNPTAWNWRAKTGFFWAGSCSLCLVWAYFRLPEPKGRTYGEIDDLFERRIPARKFKETKTNLFEGQIDVYDEDKATVEMLETTAKAN
ncbi:general substrate transporter [Lipomyces tetrasporus]|uniref:General substrate transporter n=1 Tax=Lipomyces tetrasporus TaxID=54092 RepID=A0AAD7QVQ8_9ASCO|nr:general substrate transporter [Lipomyces tetrasporus]KAJ8102402.1 general substrate transporter [Lipomyces tetrasporus]